MNTLDMVQAALRGWPQPRFDGASVVIPTLCLYPSNAVVSVYVDGGNHEFVVHDRGAAIEQLHAAIGMEQVPNSFIFSTARQRGVAVAKDSSLFHRAIYDDRDKWPAASLALLRVATTPVARSAANDALSRLAA